MEKFKQTVALGLLAVSLGVTSPFVYAESLDERSGWTLLIGGTSGGDKLGEAQYTNGESEVISAGGGLVLGLGYDIRMDDKWGLRMGLGHHWDSTNASNGEISFSRTTWEMMPYWQVNEKFSLSAGWNASFNPKLNVDYGSRGSVTFKAVTGFQLAASYHFNPRHSLEVRNLSINYEAEIVNIQSTQYSASGSVDGSYTGFFYQYHF